MALHRDLEPTAARIIVADPRRFRAAALLVGVIALAIYGRTLAPTVTLVDSGELIVAAHGLGVAHPPGFPLYVVLGHAASAIPFGNVAQRVAALSALCFAAAAALLTVVVRALLVATAGTSGRGDGVAQVVPLLVGGVLLALSRTVWSYATVAEVYGLTTLAVVALVGLALRARSVATPGALFVLAVAFGVAIGTHLVMVALAAPALLALTWNVVRARPRLLLGLAAVAALSAIAVYLYLPWAAVRGTFPNWGDPRTLERAWWHVTGRQYQAYITPSLESVGREALAFGRTLLREYGPLWFPGGLVLAGIGFVTLGRRSSPLLLALALLIGFDLAYVLVYTIAEDKAAYYLPSVVALCLASGVGAASVLARIRRRGVGVALLLLSLIGPLAHARESDRSRFLVAHDYARDVLAGVAGDGLLLTSDWQIYSPLLYFQEIERWRPDVLAVDVTLLRRSWYIDSMRARAPARWAPLRAEADAYLEDLRAWERDPERYARSVSLTRRINDRFQTMVLALMTASKRVYATADVVLPGSPDPDLAARLTRTFSLTPRGLVFALGSGGALGQVSGSQAEGGRAPDILVPDPISVLQPRGLFDGTLQLADEDVARLKVQPVYLGMTVNRGHFLLLRGDREGAAAAYQRALAWDPSYAPALDAVERLRAAR